MINSWLRPGDTGTATDAVKFLIQSVARVPRHHRRTILIRADRGFDCEALYALCEKRKWHYVVKVRVTPDLAAQIWGQAHKGRWRHLESEDDTGMEVSEILFQRQCWSRPRRVVLTRKLKPENPQGHLWDALDTTKDGELPYEEQAEVLAAKKPDAATKVKVQAAYGKLSLHFEVNQGQADEQVKFLSSGSGCTLFLTPTEAVLALRKPHKNSLSPVSGERARVRGLVPDQPEPTEPTVLRKGSNRATSLLISPLQSPPLLDL